MKKHFAKQIFAAALAISFVCGLSACREREEEQLSLKPVTYLYPEEETDKDKSPVLTRVALLHVHGMPKARTRS